MFHNVVLHWRKIFKTALTSLTTSPGAPNCCLLGKGSNLATYKLNVELNLAIKAPGKVSEERLMLWGDSWNLSYSLSLRQNESSSSDCWGRTDNKDRHPRLLRDDCHSQVSKLFKSTLYKPTASRCISAAAGEASLSLIVWVENGTIPGVNQAASWHCELANYTSAGQENFHKMLWSFLWWKHSETFVNQH